jgi:lipopolysaccharide/colanic/teichoic acid biosynthesis glycosyltransferase
MMKRILDVSGALLALLILWPLLILLGMLIHSKIGRPEIFVQQRPGKNEKLFSFYKFRTMTNEEDENGNLLPDNMRMTRLGKILRQTSLDELPSFWNVLKGDMSLVGPRPLLEAYLPLYSKEQSRRHEVKPGITGWAQINGRNSLSWEEKFQLDVWYVDNNTVWLDLKILIKTIFKVIRKEGIHSNTSATMEAFRGE